MQMCLATGVPGEIFGLICLTKALTAVLTALKDGLKQSMTRQNCETLKENNRNESLLNARIELAKTRDDASAWLKKPPTN